jgi:lipopolysaccharide/colanic/teichoic acid biosynthesis glycosyltransferase
MGYNLIKRLSDIMISIMGLLLFLPFIIIISILIKISSNGPIFYRQKRVGKNYSNFKIIKFRTMIEKADSNELLITMKDDSRITSLGAYLRKYKIDEIPQLFNVLIGDMSIVGPRPEVEKYVKLFKNDYNEILKVRPGITDLGSIEFIDENELLEKNKNPEDVYIKKILPVKINYNKQYLKKKNIFFDLYIIIKTLIYIFK